MGLGEGVEDSSTKIKPKEIELDEKPKITLKRSPVLSNKDHAKSLEEIEEQNDFLEHANEENETKEEKLRKKKYEKVVKFTKLESDKGGFIKMDTKLLGEGV